MGSVSTTHRQAQTARDRPARFLQVTYREVRLTPVSLGVACRRYSRSFSCMDEWECQLFPFIYLPSSQAIWDFLGSVHLPVPPVPPAQRSSFLVAAWCDSTGCCASFADLDPINHPSHCPCFASPPRSSSLLNSKTHGTGSLNHTWSLMIELRKHQRSRYDANNAVPNTMACHSLVRWRSKRRRSLLPPGRLHDGRRGNASLPYIRG